MTPLMPPPAPGEVEAFIGEVVGQVVTDLSVAFSCGLVNVGRKPGACMSVALAA